MSPSPDLAFIVLAAGRGTRMKSRQAKVLHEIGGLSLLGHVLKLCAQAGVARLCVVAGHDQPELQAEIARIAPQAAIVTQRERLGTGHAVAQARSALADMEGNGEGDIVVLCADTPFIRPETLARLRRMRRAGAALVLAGFESDDPSGYGRIIRDGEGAPARIVEERDANARERAGNLCHSGVMCVAANRLFQLVGALSSNNAAGEYYLTDIVALARESGLSCRHTPCEADEASGVNSPADLARLEAAFQARARAMWLAEGVRMTAPETVFFSHDCALAPDVVIEPYVVLGLSVTVGESARIRAFSSLEGCRIRRGAVVGPFARLRPGTDIGEDARIGNFVEVKNAAIGRNARANHLSYLGDACVGESANIGAGAITCNYDGADKHRTDIAAHAFIGSNSSLIAPVTIGEGAYVGSGSVVTTGVPADALALARARQENKAGLAALLQRRKRSRKRKESG